MAKNMEENTDVFVSFFGNENELTQLRDLFNSPNCRLVPGTINKGCYLTACRFSNITDKKVGESARKLVTMIKAFAKIELGGDFQSVNIGRGKIVVNSENATTIIRSLNGNVDGKADINVSGITATATFKANVPEVISRDKDGNVVIDKPQVPQERLHDYYLNRCDEEIDGNVLDALYYFAQETSFYSLYKNISNHQARC